MTGAVGRTTGVDVRGSRELNRGAGAFGFAGAAGGGVLRVQAVSKMKRMIAGK